MAETADHGLTRNGAVELAKRIERQILLGTWGRIHNLRVEVNRSRLIVRGRTPSYYVKQLVLQSVFDVLGPTHSIPIEFDIQVGASERPVLAGDNDLWGVPRD
jgi:hypothetical protein